MLAKLITLALAADIALVCLAETVAALHAFLPIGGSHLTQLGFLLGLTVSAAHVWDALRR